MLSGDERRDPDCEMLIAPFEGHSPASQLAEREASIEPPLLRVLLIAADVVRGDAVEMALARMPHYEPQITRAGCASAGRFAIAADSHHVVLIDAAMGAELGPEALCQLRRAGGTPYIVLTHTPPLQTADELSAEPETGTSWTHALASGAAASIEHGEVTPRVLETIIRLVAERHALQCTMAELAGWSR